MCHAPQRRMVVEDFARISVFALHRLGAFSQQSRCFPFLYPGISLTSNRWKLVLEYADGRQQSFQVRWHRGTVGGEYPQLVCRCGHVSRKLYLHFAGACCRICLRCGVDAYLGYFAETRSPNGRRALALQRLRLRLGGSSALTEHFPQRPQGMRKARYRRLTQQAAHLLDGIPRKSPLRTQEPWHDMLGGK